MDDYWRDFVQESEEHITELNNSLLALERSPTNDDAMEAIFRTAHTLKGNCGAMGLTRASDLAHAIEDLLDAIRADEVAVTSELMDTIFDGVDELEAMIDEVAVHGEIRTDPAPTIDALRTPLDDLDEFDRERERGPISTPTDDEIDATLARFDPPADEDHDAYLVRISINEVEDVNNGVLVVDALIDAFDLIGTDPSREAIENRSYGGTFDAVFGTAVGEAAITAALEPVGAVSSFEIVSVTDRFEAIDDPVVGDDDGEADADTTAVDETDADDDLSPDRAQDLSVDELLDEFTEFDDLDAMVEEVDDVSAFDEMGEAGSFHDLLEEDVDIDPSVEATDEDAAGSGDDAPTDDERSTPETQTSESAVAHDDDDDQVDDAGAVFDELKQEVEMVGFDELQTELDELEFDEFDSDDEVDMDELLGDDVDVADNSFLDVTEAELEADVDEMLADDAADAISGPDRETDDGDGDGEGDDSDDDVAVGDESETGTEPTIEAEAGIDADAEDAFESLSFDDTDLEEDEAAPPFDREDDLLEEDLSALDGVDFGDSSDAAAEADTAAASEFTSDDQSGDDADESAFESDPETGLETTADTDGTAVGEDLDSENDSGLETEPEPALGGEAVDRGESDDVTAGSPSGGDETESEPTAAGDDADIGADDAGNVSTDDESVAADAGEVGDFDDSLEGETVAFDDPVDTDVDMDMDVDVGTDDYDFADYEDLDNEAVDDYDYDDDFDEYDQDASGGTFTDPTTGFDPVGAGGSDAVDDGGFGEAADGEAESESGESTDAPASTEGSSKIGGLNEMEIPDITVPEVADRPEADESDEIQSVRVDVDQIDSLLNLVEGLVTSRVRLRHAIESGEDLQTIDRELDDLEDLTAELQETVMDVRLVPLQTVANRLPRVVRDIARDQDKEVVFERTGDDVELDRSILDRIGDPLTHLVRNAVDHGIEPPAEREAAGKPREGTIELRTTQSRDRVTIEIEDDGSGLDPDRLRSAAVDADILTESEADDLDDGEALDLVFHPGLSTAAEVTDVSGRGVGMDVVKRTVDALDGSVSVDSEPGEGTTVTMGLPVTVAIADVLFVECGGEVFGIPTKVVQDIEDANTIQTVDDRSVLVDDGTDDEIPVVDLADALETPEAGADGDGMIVRIRDDVRPLGVHCAEVRGQREVVIKPFEGFMGDIPGLSGATVRGRGEVVNILDVNTL
ncbi:Hpt domain-containing protein [Halomontanus rarus]|uniref:Hpt domain-containing protein n=1 Tax=Halomontanus rarus TaxID=3034020 RepID=UPI0023E7CEB2|nr:Hpt domain-containing protein [Halovivax sp. TS33]